MLIVGTKEVGFEDTEGTALGIEEGVDDGIDDGV